MTSLRDKKGLFISETILTLSPQSVAKLMGISAIPQSCQEGTKSPSGTVAVKPLKVGRLGDTTRAYSVTDKHGIVSAVWGVVFSMADHVIQVRMSALPPGQVKQELLEDLAKRAHGAREGRAVSVITRSIAKRL